ncbi:hypothetical protein GGR53DRAFT_469017 [Hypoxylon sp. FL1150]|nr:hypothetical protein GGR53DRAFT_469017 [Hypoxylon sp. FL1150]
MAKSCLPVIPLAIFGVIEPAMLYVFTHPPTQPLTPHTTTLKTRAANLPSRLPSIWAYITAHRDLPAFYLAQAPPFPSPSPSSPSPSSPSPSPSIIPPQALVLLLQLANVYLLLAALAVLCTFTPHAVVARWYLTAVAFADYGHIWACYKGVGPDVFWDVGTWNDMLWGGIGVSAALNVVRWLALLGAFGAVRDPRDPVAAAAGKKKEA